MTITIARIGRNETVKYAAEELARLICKMDSSAIIYIRLYEKRNPEKKGIIWVGLDEACGENKLDDAIFVDVVNASGIITGSNPRSVLMAAYRFMYELGCRFLRPGKAGEIVPERKLTEGELTVKVDEKASYRHRSMCIEGTVGYEHVRNMIEWLPKVGMNGYFVQFTTPGAFFKRYANVDRTLTPFLPPEYAEKLAQTEPYIKKQELDDDDIDHIWAALEDEITLRGLNYHATGHGWTCEPFGIHATSWATYKEPISEETRNCFAELDGVRQLFGGKPLNTNLCYSNPTVRNKMNDAIVEYCKAHPAVNYLHFWLADGKNNHCECEECSKMRPADYYVMLLNELDEKLTAAGVDTKIVCLIYLDLLWAPEVHTIKNQDRFVLMFAPITRTYTTAFTDFDPDEKVELTPYVRNKLVMPQKVSENVARLKIWQNEQLRGDSFDFDYHLMWDHYLDPGYYECARILHTDMANLDKIGLNGMVSCQTNRAAFPTGLPMYAMAKALWDKTSVFEDVADEYFTAAFGADGAAVKVYLASLSEYFCPAFMRGEKPISKEEMISKVIAGKQAVNGFDASFIKQNTSASEDVEHLKYHAELVRLYADLLLAGLRGLEEEKTAAVVALNDYMSRAEGAIGDYFDNITFRRVYDKYIPSLK